MARGNKRAKTESGNPDWRYPFLREWYRKLQLWALHLPHRLSISQGDEGRGANHYPGATVVPMALPVPAHVRGKWDRKHKQSFQD